MIREFSDKLEFNATQKTALSVRDGVLEYLSDELGLEESGKIVTVYRSPATIANIADKMIGIPLSDDHVPIGQEVPHPVGKVEDSTLVDLFDHTSNTYLAIQNRINVADEMMSALQNGKRELSLGYSAELVPHEKYDYEQRSILPHHLAVVVEGRCGPACSFLDKKKETPVDKLFFDAEGKPNLEEIVRVATLLPEAIKKLPMDKLTEVMPVLQEIARIATEANTPEEQQAPAMDEEPAEEPNEEEKMKDAGGFGQEPPPKDIKDSAEFVDALKNGIAKHAEVIDKARGFLDEGYVFAGKDTKQVMVDALKSEHGEQKFEDSELDVAFKLLKKTESKTADFGDGLQDSWSELNDKEL